MKNETYLHFARVIARVARAMKPESADLLSAFDERTCTIFKCGSLPLLPPPVNQQDTATENEPVP